jgi:lysyl-tRNA synthetase class 1
MSEEIAPIMPPAWVAEVLEEFEAKQDFDETEVLAQLGGAAREHADLDPREKRGAQAELLAFDFFPAWEQQRSPWNTYFGPRLTLNGKYSPDVKEVDKCILLYWRRRMQEARNPILRARYADLVWDIFRTATGERPPFQAAGIAADAYVGCGTIAADTWMNGPRRLGRGLQIALQINDRKRVEAARDALFALAERAGGVWAWVKLYDFLQTQPKVALTAEQQARLIAALQACVDDVSSRVDGAESAETLPIARRIASYYSNIGRLADAQRVIRACGQAVERLASSAQALLAVAWLGDVLAAYRDYGLTTDADRVLIVSKEKGHEAEDSMPSLQLSIQIDREELELFVEAMTAGGFDETLRRIAAEYLPRVAELREGLEEEKRRHPLLTLMGTSKLGEGHVESKTGPANQDPEGALMAALSRQIGLRSIFLSQVIDRAREKHCWTAEALVSWFYESPLFDPACRGLVTQGIKAYLSADHVQALHVLVPQIERSLRRLLGGLGQPTDKPRRGNPAWMVEKTLNDILEQEPVVRERLGDDVHTYLLTFLAEPRGHNLRNKLSHGLMTDQDFRRELSDRVLHILLLLGVPRQKSGQGESPRPPEPTGESSEGKTENRGK